MKILTAALQKSCLFNERKFEESISHYTTAIKINPSYSNAHYNLGNALAQKGAIREAINHYKETLRLRPNHVSARNNLGMALVPLEKYEHK